MTAQRTEESNAEEKTGWRVTGVEGIASFLPSTVLLYIRIDIA